MSLKSMLSGNTDAEREFQAILRDILPAKEAFQTLSGNPPFTAYKPLVPYCLSNSSDASIIGIAFDYLARTMIAQQLNKNKEAAYLDLVAIAGLKKVKKQVDRELYDILANKYIDVLADFIDYIYSNNAFSNDILNLCTEQEEIKAFSKFINKASYDSYMPDNNIERLFSGAYYFAKLEQVFRSGGILPEDISKSFLSDPNEEIQRDLHGLCKVFREKFIDLKLVQPDSVVIFNPTFGVGSIMCGGADADVYIDGTLCDFKSSKDTSYKWKEVAQLLGYYFLNYIAYYGRNYKTSAPLVGYKILRVAFYKARYGEIEYFDMSKLGQQAVKNTVDKLAHYFKTHPDNLNLAILSFKLPPDVTPEIFDVPYPFAE